MDRYKRAWFQNQSSCSPAATTSQPGWPCCKTWTRSARSLKWLRNISPKTTTSATRATVRHFTAVLYPEPDASDVHSSVGDRVCWDTVAVVKRWRTACHEQIGREGLTGSRERPGQEPELAHDGGDHHLGTLALRTQTSGEHTQGWVAAHSHDGWHVQGLAQGSGSEWTDVSAAAAASDRAAPAPGAQALSVPVSIAMPAEGPPGARQGFQTKVRTFVLPWSVGGGGGQRLQSALYARDARLVVGASCHRTGRGDRTALIRAARGLVRPAVADVAVPVGQSADPGLRHAGCRGHREPPGGVQHAAPDRRAHGAVRRQRAVGPAGVAGHTAAPGTIGDRDAGPPAAHHRARRAAGRSPGLVPHRRGAVQLDAGADGPALPGVGQARAGPARLGGGRPDLAWRRRQYLSPHRVRPAAGGVRPAAAGRW